MRNEGVWFISWPGIPYYWPGSRNLQPFRYDYLYPCVCAYLCVCMRVCYSLITRFLISIHKHVVCHVCVSTILSPTDPQYFHGRPLVCHPDLPIHVIIFLICVKFSMGSLSIQSAMGPLHAASNVISKWGRDDSTPFWGKYDRIEGGPIIQHGQFFLNWLRPRDTYMRHQTRPSLVQIMACSLFGAKPISEPMLDYCKLDFCEHISMKF